jgi:hypothetical protein
MKKMEKYTNKKLPKVGLDIKDFERFEDKTK